MPSTAIDVPAVTNQDNEIPRDRVRDGAHAHAIFRKLELDDSLAEKKRARIDFQINGGEPYDSEKLREAGRGEDANVNFLEAKFEDDMAQAPYIDMTTVSRKLWNVQTNKGDEQQKKKWSDIISNHFTRIVREWQDFDYFRLRLSQQYTRHGLGFIYWEDEFDWRWRSDGQNAFKLPRSTEARASAIPHCVCKREISVTDLYYQISKPAAAELGRWNIEAVKQAIIFTAYGTERPFWEDSWERFTKEMKENDIEFGSRGQKVHIYHLWVKEFDGTVSHFMGLQDGVAMKQGGIIDAEQVKEGSSEMVGNGFLYVHRKRFKSFESAIIPFALTIGTAGTFHTIRGQGEMAFAPIAISNRTRNKMIDCATAASSIILQADSAVDAENFAYIRYGPFMIASANNVKFTATAMPDVGERLMPILEDQARLRSQVSNSSSASNAVDKSKQPQSKYQIQNNQNKDSALGSAQLTMWYGPFSKLGEQMYRRLVNPDLREDMPGGKEAFQFRVRCMAEGVPAEALSDFHSVEAVRTIGNGSPQLRQFGMEQVYEKKDGMDETGRRQALIDVLAAIPGVSYEQAEQYVGPEKPRDTDQDEFAVMENALFKQGIGVPVTENQNDWVHCEHHAELVRQFVDSFEQGQIDGAKLVPVLSAALDNMLEHSERLTKDKTREKESAWVRKFVQQNGGTLEQQQNKLIAEQQRAQEASQQQPEGQPADPKLQQDSELHAQKIAQLQQETFNRQKLFEAKLAAQNQEAEQRRTLADLTAAHNIATKTASLVANGV